MEFNEFEKDLINQVSLSVEKDRSGKAIDWSYWAKHKAIKPKEAALLAYHVCPNMVCSALRIEENHLYPYQEIKELKSLLASHEKQWTLAELLRFLREYGYFVPFGMEQAVFNGKLELVDGVAIVSPALINHAGTEPSPRNNGYYERDKNAIQQVKDRPELLKMRAGEIKKELQKTSKIFIGGYDGWWRNNPVFPKSKAGRTKGKKLIGNKNS